MHVFILCLHYTTIQYFGVCMIKKKIIIFIQQGCIKLIQSDSKAFIMLPIFLFQINAALWILYSSNNSEKCIMVPQKKEKKRKQHNCLQHWKWSEMFLKQQIRILEWFLKDHVTLKTAVMMLNIQHCFKGINYILKYVTLDHKTSLKSLGYICSNSQKYIVWVKIFLLCQKSLGY